MQEGYVGETAMKQIEAETYDDRGRLKMSGYVQCIDG